jgi:hypothetical protein
MPQRLNENSRLAVSLSLLLTLLAAAGARAQELSPGAGRPIVGTTDGLYVPSKPQSEFVAGSKVHMDTFGKACIVVAGYSLPRTDFAKIFRGPDAPDSAEGGKAKVYEHIISAENRCSQAIRLHVCYYGSQSCVAIKVAGHDHEQASLGVSSGIPGFRYQYTEQF